MLTPKFYFFDLGVMRALERTLGSEVLESSYGYGRLFEHFFIWEVIKHNEYSRMRHKLSYLITKDGAEIDLIIERQGKSDVLIEIKSGISPNISDARHILGFKEAFPNCELWVVSQIERDREEAGVRFLSWQKAIEELFY